MGESCGRAEERPETHDCALVRIRVRVMGKRVRVRVRARVRVNQP